MKKKQKWELLKYAYDNYPKDSVARFKNVNQVDHVSNGKFTIHEDEQGFHVLGGDNGDCFYSLGEWATIVPEEKPSILTGKCAIQVNNEREFKLLMEHYEGKGWRSLSDDIPSRVGYVPFTWSYEDSFGHAQEDFRKSEGRRVIPFASFAAEAGITVPVFVMTSEDGVPLYSGMEMWGATYFAGLKEWRTQSFNDEPFILSENNTDLPDDEDFPYLSSPELSKAFSTKEAAEAWILEANKPKLIRLQEDTKIPCTVTKDYIYFDLMGYRETILDKEVFVIPYDSVRTSASELEEIYAAYKSLQ